MKRSRSLAGLPLPVRRALGKLGTDLSAARRRQRISMATLAERAFITRKTLGKVERGDAGVSIGIYATVLFALGLVERLQDLADSAADRLGQALEDERLPKRIRSRSR
jgi:transcriptional regulator with XRE-family HTH domain